MCVCIELFLKIFVYRSTKILAIRGYLKPDSKPCHNGIYISTLCENNAINRTSVFKENIKNNHKNLKSKSNQTFKFSTTVSLVLS